MNAVTLKDLQPLMIDLMLVFATLQLFVLDLLIPAGRKRALGGLTALLLAGIFALSFVVDTSGQALYGAYTGGEWPLFFKRVFLVAGALTALGSIDYVDRYFPHRQGEFYILILSSLLGMTLLPGANDLILLIVCFELMGIPLAILAGYAKSEDPKGPGRHGPEAGFKLYLVSAVSTAITMFGLSLVYGMAGTTKLAFLAEAAASPLLSLGMFMLLSGMAFKVGAVPFHMWVPDTYQGGPLPFISFLSVAPKGAGFAALAAVFLQGFGAQHAQWAPVLIVLIVVTIVVGNLMALPQTDVKRLFAFSGVSQIGYMLIGLAAANAYGTGMLLFYVAAYVVTNMGAFFVVQAVSPAGATVSIRELDGLWKRSPWLALALLLFLLSLAGIPFVAGFWAKLYVFMAAYEAGHAWLVFFGAFFAIVALFYYLQVARAAYMMPAASTAPVTVHFGLKTAIVFCLLAVVAMGVYPRPFIDSALAASRAFFG